MAKTNAPSAVPAPFDGIVDNKAETLPAVAKALFFGLIVWGLVFSGYYLLSGWTSAAEFEASMKASSGAAATAPGAPR